MQMGPGPVNGDPEVWRRNMAEAQDKSDPTEKAAWYRFMDQFAARSDAPESVRGLQQQWLNERASVAGSAGTDSIGGTSTTQDDLGAPNTSNWQSTADHRSTITATDGPAGTMTAAHRRDMWRGALDRYRGGYPSSSFARGTVTGSEHQTPASGGTSYSYMSRNRTSAEGSTASTSRSTAVTAF
ncbi:hypothetical protein I316_04811 [Kwoniella heveanensis BCC8398]|uniref:Uncharacterized protein n=1 Tax=Kwoniella heveanensis BCC8398 TaxID=1296120 RepID=A0A1B9GQP9_9TREE|nr:hypothetical protein I316_04811 [Kwoniella heveanensis BCC8398]